MNTEEKLVSFIIGFIDADGHVCKDKRKGRENYIEITIKLHSSWKDVLEEMGNRLYDVLKFNHPNTIINKCGYAKVCFGRKDIIKLLCNKIRELNLPVMERKWNVVLTFHQNEV